MKVVDLYARVRRACHVEGMSQRQAARVFGIDPKTVAKMLRFAVPPGYRRSKPPVRPKLDPLLPVIDRILAQLRQSYWEVSRKPLISRGETDGIPGFTEYVVPFPGAFSA